MILDANDRQLVPGDKVRFPRRLKPRGYIYGRIARSNLEPEIVSVVCGKAIVVEYPASWLEKV